MVIFLPSARGQHSRMASSDSAFHPALPHGPIEQVFEHVFFVTGTTRPTFFGLDWQFSRNMTIVRDGEALTLVNTVRLDDAGLEALEALGTVRHVVRLGAFHGMDDAFYLDRYGASLWALQDMVHEHTHPTDHVLRPGAPLPWADASLFVYETAKQPEGLLLVARAGGILIACDSLQNWEAPDAFFDEASAARMQSMGFFRTANVGPGFRTACEPAAADFQRILELPFRHLVSAHGTVLRDEAKPHLRETFAELYGI